MPYFPTQNDMYRLLQRELPIGVFPDGAPQDFYHTAETYSYALNFASAYANCVEIYNNFFPQTCDDVAINQWEIKVFGQLNALGLTLQERQQLVLNKLRATHGISTMYIMATISFNLPPGTVYEIAVGCCGQGQGGWVLDESQLDLETYLNFNSPFSGAAISGPNLCELTPAELGISQQDWDNLQYAAYVYFVYIYGVTLTDQERTQLDLALSAAEPARSSHVIIDGVDPSQMLNNPLC